MEIYPDFKELLRLFGAHKVSYVIVGGYALAFHGAVRFTGDIDLFVRPEAENAKRIIAALNEFGFGTVDLVEADFQTEHKVIQLGVPPVRIDIMTSLTGLSWQQVLRGRVEGKYGDTHVFFIGKNELVANKKSLGRKKDVADLEALGQE